jgi:hypothetical protein
MASFHGRLIDQLPQSWLPLLAQGAKVVLSIDHYELDFSDCPEVIVMPAVATGALPLPGTYVDVHYRTLPQSSRDAA